MFFTLIKLPHGDFVQLYKRMLFNEFAKNYDDHTKNIAFLMNKKGEWSLAPAYDMTFSYRKDSPWVSAHQMLINDKAKDIIIDDLLAVAEKAGIKQSNAKSCIEQVKTAVSEWTRFAEEAELSAGQVEFVKKNLIYTLYSPVASPNSTACLRPK